MTALETAISDLQAKHEDPKHTKELEDRIAALEQKLPENDPGIEKNLIDIEGLDDRIWRSESDISVLGSFVSI